jgi:hypothetical protein
MEYFLIPVATGVGNLGVFPQQMQGERYHQKTF